MWPFSAFFAVSGVSSLISNRKKSNTGAYIFFCGLILFCIAAFRDKSIGTDTISYITNFLSYRYRDWDWVFGSHGARKEYGYYALIKILSSVTDNYTVLLAVVALIFTAAVCLFIYRYSRIPFLSFVLLVCMGFFYFSLSGLRQVIAMSILIFSYKYVRERKLVPFLLLVALAYLFHNTAIVFLIAYPLAYIKVNWKHLVVVVGAMIMSLFFQAQVKAFIFEVLGWERIAIYKNYGYTLTLTGFLIQLSIMFFTMLYYRQIRENEPKDISLYNLMFLGLIFQVFTPVISEFFRISMYFSVFNIALVPNALMQEKNKNITYFYYFFIIAISLIYFYLFGGRHSDIIPYKFIWNT